MTRQTSGHSGALAVVFDGDDTLWSTEQLYDTARSKARTIVAASGLSGARWEEIERQVDLDNVEMFSYSTERFPNSCVQAYEKLCYESGRVSDPLIATRIQTAASSVFESDAPSVPGARETLLELRARGIRLALLTKGDPCVQRRRVEHSGLADLFDTIQIVTEKSTSTIREIVMSLGVEVGSAWMVGNSVRSDVLPAIAVGLRAAWIDAHVWEHERTHDHLVDQRIVVLASLAEVPDLVTA